MKQAYLDCSSGISGDMFLAVLIDAGVPVDRLFGELKKLPLGFYEFKRTRAVRGGLVGTRVEVRVPSEQPHRHLADIQALLEKASLPEKAAGQAQKVFHHLAEVEGKLHNVPPGEVHFHEVGAVDAIIDIVGTCVGLELLEISDLICSPLNVGSGRVDAAHGSLPVPAPATMELLKDIPVYSSGVVGELVTPTGAALVAALASGFGPLPAMKIAKIGYGAGEKDYRGHPNIARLFLGEQMAAVVGQPGLPGDEIVSVIEAHVSDMSPQLYGDFLEQALDAGALDVTSSLTRTEKNRPGLALSIICEPGKSDELSQLLFAQTTTTGLRIYEARRKVTEREPMAEETSAGDEIVSVIEAHVDGMSPQLYGNFLEQALAAGALEVTSNSTRSEKNRPGLTISIICEPAKSDELSQVLFAQTTAAGLRIYEARRKVMEREQGAEEASAGDEIVSVIEAHVHDLSPQLYGNFLEQALAAGALEVTSSSTRSEKNRPGLTISIICEPAKSDELSQLVFAQTTTTGVRIYEARRKVMAREQGTEEAPAGGEIVSVIEAHVHDLSPQLYGDFLEQALAAGALEVTGSATRSEKNRPGLTISIICEPAKSDELSQLVFAQTTTTGLRIYEARRKVMEREQGTVETPRGEELVSVIEANIDDMSPQLYGYFLEQALAAGALDVTCASAQMKKNRPGLVISILCEPEKTDALSQLLFEQTTTIGVRIYEARRKVLEREQVTVETPYGAVQVKVARREGKVVNAAPEFDDCQRLAREKSVPLKQVIAAAEAAYLQQIEKAPGE
jgi:hypothetical protein